MNIYEYLEGLSGGIVGVGVDALTLTATGAKAKRELDKIIHTLGDEISHDRKKPFRFQKAQGWSRGSVSYADTRDIRRQRSWAILMVKGPLAGKIWMQAAVSTLPKCTRVDICVDVKMSKPDRRIVRKIRDGHKKRGTEMLLIEGKGDTLTVGSRESSEYIRIYDKSEHYQEELGNVWRFEVEYKRTMAQPVLELLAQGDANQLMQDMVWHSMTKKHLPTPLIGNPVNIKGHKAAVSSPEQKLLWIGRQVQPTVTFLRQLGMEAEVLKALGLDNDV